MFLEMLFERGTSLLRPKPDLLGILPVFFRYLAEHVPQGSQRTAELQKSSAIFVHQASFVRTLHSPTPLSAAHWPLEE